MYGIYKKETFSHNISEYSKRFLRAVQGQDEGKALYYAYILAIFLDSEDLVLSMIRKESKKRNEGLIDEWIKGYKRSNERLFLAGSVVLLCRTLVYSYGEYHQLISHHLASPITVAEIPDRAFDKHTRSGKKMGRGLKHFFREAGTVRNERFPNNWDAAGTKAYLDAEKQKMYLYGEKRKVSLAKTKNIIKATKKRFLITKLPFDYKRAVLTQARTSENKVFAFVVELPKGKRKFMKGPFESAELAQQHVIYNEVKRKLASKYLHPIKCEVKTYNDGSVFLECEELGKANLNKVTIKPPNKVDSQWFQVLDDSSNDVVPKPFDFLDGITKSNESIWIRVIINYCFRWIFRIGDAADRNLMLEKSTGRIYSTDEIRLKRKNVHPTIWNNRPPKGVLNLMKQFVADHQLLNTVLDEVKRWKKSLKVISSQDFPITKGIKERIDRLLGHPEKVLGIDESIPNLELTPTNKITQKRQSSKAASTPKRSKFQDWVYETVSCCNGCSNDCVYCFAKGGAVHGRRKKEYRLTLDEWKEGKVRPHDVNKNQKRHTDPVMFPGTHDINPGNFEACFTVLKKLLTAGNRVLIVSKPRIQLITKICEDLEEYKKNMLFRFTIGSINDEVLSFWEPHAPSYNERKESLKYAYDNGYRTSVSIEPMLDAEHIQELVDDLSPFVNHSIWIGTMNNVWYFETDEQAAKNDTGRTRAKTNTAYYGGAKAKKIREETEGIVKGQSKASLKKIYEELKDKKVNGKDEPLVKWKWHIKKALGLPQPDKPEQWPLD